ncbi:MAG: LysR family transcriptional regulator [Rhizobium sp.]|nr:LysR family transcriptional regulator [Rhizobium sp.]MBX9459585.1 LysR family transcriptional regulator [Rhizobium sp.]
MDWDDLRIFLAIARAGTVSEAARQLELDHSTVSRRLANLENRLAIRLFDRAGRRLGINAAGEQLRRTAERLESGLLSDLAVLEAMQGSRVGTVRIGVPEGLGVGYLAGRLGGLAEAYPEIALELVALPQNYSLATREVDIAITLDRPEFGNIAVRKLTDYVLQFFGTEAYFARHGRPAETADLQSHRLCGYIPQLLYTPLLDYLVFDGVRMQPTVKSTSVVAHVEMVRSGSTLGMLPAFICAGRADLVPILPADRITRSYWLTVHEDLRGVERIRIISEALVQLARQDRTLFLPD